MAKKPYRRNNQNRPTESRANMIAIPCEKYEALVKAYTEISVVRQYLQESTTSYADADNVRLILGIKKEG